MRAPPAPPSLSLTPRSYSVTSLDQAGKGFVKTDGPVRITSAGDSGEQGEESAGPCEGADSVREQLELASESRGRRTLRRRTRKRREMELNCLLGSLRTQVRRSEIPRRVRSLTHFLDCRGISPSLRRHPAQGYLPNASHRLPRLRHPPQRRDLAGPGRWIVDGDEGRRCLRSAFDASSCCPVLHLGELISFQEPRLEEHVGVHLSFSPQALSRTR